MKLIRFKIKRQNDPKTNPYWEHFEIRAKPGMTVVSALNAIKKYPVNAEGLAVIPIVWENNCLGECCGTCTMVINGHVRLACTTFIDKMDQPIRLEPLTKFKIIRDLVVDRSKLYQDLEKTNSWMHLDGYFATPSLYTRRPAPDNLVTSLSQCTHCGACLEACPQYHSDSNFVGALAISQSNRYDAHPNGQVSKETRLNSLMQSGGTSDCDNAQNCVKVCPMEIPLTTAIAKVKRKVMGKVFRNFFS